MLHCPLCGKSGHHGNETLPSHIFPSLEEIFKKYSPAVVRVVNFYKNDDNSIGTCVSSGFFLGTTGLIVSPLGAVTRGQQILIENGSFSSDADIIAMDNITQLAILRPRDPYATKANIAFSWTGNEIIPSPTALLLAITCATDSNPSPRLGMATGKNISFGDDYFPTQYLRSDIAAHGGMPGSPIFRCDGQCVGMLIASIPQTGESFILPIRAIQRVVEDIVTHGHVCYAYVGIRAQLDKDGKTPYPIYVASIISESPASNSSVHIGDHILSFNDVPLHSIGDLFDAIFFTRPNSNIPITLQRNGETISTTILSAQRHILPMEMAEP
ncbi:MAG: S1C family serine protease [Puniceicoccales bacterium]|nr:S1C family serine protease [Puniceicoccales bacterium]